MEPNGVASVGTQLDDLEQDTLDEVLDGLSNLKSPSVVLLPGRPLQGTLHHVLLSSQWRVLLIWPCSQLSVARGLHATIDRLASGA
jgi:hypothetical protein